jgi:uncharacterized protein (DUF1778 family)
MTEKTETLSFRVTPQLKQALDRAAAADDRSVSSYVQRLLIKQLTGDGFLKAEKRGHDKV